MAAGNPIDHDAFETPLPVFHDESHPLLQVKDAQCLSDFDDPADRLTVCELPRKSLLPLS